ncbi:MAG: glycosyltransferase [Deltaproteobacteria bacterium]
MASGTAPLPVAIFIHTLNLGGAEGQVVELLRSLDRRRFTPSLFCFYAEGHHARALRELGIEPEVIPPPRSLGRPEVLVTIARVALACRRRGVRLLHAQDFYTNLIALPAARLAGARCLVSRLDLAHWYGGLRRFAVAWTSRRADRVWVNAEAVRDLVVLEDGVPPERVSLVRNGLDLTRFDSAAREGSAEAIELTGGGLVPCVINVANMNHPVKGQDDLLLAMDRVRRLAPSARLLLVGDGPLRAGYERRARELGLGGCVVFAGHRTDVPALLARATLAVSASHAEGLSNAVIEAMAARLPVVATAVGGNVELVRPGVSGWLVPPSNAAVLAERILVAIERPGEARELGERARSFVEAELSLDRMVQGFERLYERMALDSERPPRLRRSARSARPSRAPTTDAEPAPV